MVKRQKWCPVVADFSVDLVMENGPFAQKLRVVIKVLLNAC